MLGLWPKKRCPHCNVVIEDAAIRCGECARERVRTSIWGIEFLVSWKFIGKHYATVNGVKHETEKDQIQV